MSLSHIIYRAKLDKMEEDARANVNEGERPTSRVDLPGDIRGGRLGDSRAGLQGDGDGPPIDLTRIGMPLRLLKYAAATPEYPHGQVVIIETNNKTVYRGKLIEVEDNMNITMIDVIATKNETQLPRIDSLDVRGSQIRMVLLPESLTETPIYRDMGAREVEQSFRGRPRGRGGPRGRGRGMGRGGGGRGRGRGGFSDRGRGRGGFNDRGRGGFVDRGRGGYGDRSRDRMDDRSRDREDRRSFDDRRGDDRRGHDRSFSSDGRRSYGDSRSDDRGRPDDRRAYDDRSRPDDRRSYSSSSDRRGYDDRR